MYPRPTLPNEVEIWAHRGGGLRPEKVHGMKRNTLESFKFSLHLGLNGFETDVCLTKDNEPIIYHPGSTPSSDPTQMSWKKAKLKNSNLLHLDNLIDFLLNCQTYFQCLLEIKENSKSLVELVAQKIINAGLSSRVIVTAPRNLLIARLAANLTVDSNMLGVVKKFIYPDIRIHLIDTWPTNIVKQALKINADTVSFGWLNDSLISRIVFFGFFQHLMMHQCQEANQAQIRVFGGITETDDQIEALLKASGGFLNGIVTDDPEGSMKFLKK